MENCFTGSNPNDSECDEHDEEGEEEEDEFDSQTTSCLMTNLAVLEMLQPRVQQRQQQQQLLDEEMRTNATNAKRFKKHKLMKSLRHRDWIERTVVDYIQNSATMQFHNEQNASRLQYRLQRRRPTAKKRQRNHPSNSDDQDSSIFEVSSSSQSLSMTVTTTVDGAVNGVDVPTVATESEAELVHTRANRPDDVVSTDTSKSSSSSTTGFDLTEAEAIQIINCSPKELVDIHLLIDSLHERMSMQQHEELLSTIQQYRTIQNNATLKSAPASATTNMDISCNIDSDYVSTSTSRDSKQFIKRENGILPPPHNVTSYNDCNGDNMMDDILDCKPAAKANLDESNH
jgi:RNA polymerase Rpb4